MPIVSGNRAESNGTNGDIELMEPPCRTEKKFNNAAVDDTKEDVPGAGDGVHSMPSRRERDG